MPNETNSISIPMSGVTTNFSPIGLPATRTLQDFRFWERLEPRARVDEFSTSVQARINDPLWMLTRQWQFGEFQGEDAGSPVRVRVTTETTNLTRYKPGGIDSELPVQSIENKIPLEVIVEKELVGSQALNLRQRMQIGLAFEQDLGGNGFDSSKIQLIKEQLAGETDDFPLLIQKHSGPDREIHNDNARQILNSVAGVAFDGRSLLLRAHEIHENDEIFRDIDLSDDEITTFIDALDRLKEKYLGEYVAADLEAGAWDRRSLDYRFCVAAPALDEAPLTFVSSRYPGGTLDWPHFTLSSEGGNPLGVTPADDNESDDPEKLFIPAPVRFKGMPKSRWWAFEDAAVDFGRIEARTVDLGKLLLMQFALAYGDDWFQIPLPLKVGSISRIKSLIVEDVFEEEHIIERASSSENPDWKRWDMFSIAYSRNTDINTGGNGPSFEAADILLLSPTLGRGEETPAFEEVRFIRDEMANKVWAIEHTITGAMDTGVSAFDCWKHIRLEEEESQLNADLVALWTTTTEKLPPHVENLLSEVDQVENLNLVRDEDSLLNFQVVIQEVSDTIEDHVLGADPSNLVRKRRSTLDVSRIFEEYRSTVSELNRRKVLDCVSRIIGPIVKAVDPIITAIWSAGHPCSIERLRTDVQRIREALRSILTAEVIQEQADLLQPPLPANDPAIPGYRLMSTVPRNWIPYVSTHLEGQHRQTQLVQARMVRDTRNTLEAVEPLGRILGSTIGDAMPHTLDEEAVARHGTRITIHRQRTRWIDGSTHVWIGRKVGPGRGEGSSGLKFDYLKLGGD